jgi:hypothetical protein
MRMTASWSGSNNPTAYKSVTRDPRHRASSPSDYQSDMQCAPSDAPASKGPISLVILPLRAQASRRCETQAPLSGKPPSCAKHFGPLTPFRALRDLVAGDGAKNGFSLRTKNRHKPKELLDTKSPIQVPIDDPRWREAVFEHGTICRPEEWARRPELPHGSSPVG